MCSSAEGVRMSGGFLKVLQFATGSSLRRVGILCKDESSIIDLTKLMKFNSVYDLMKGTDSQSKEIEKILHEYRENSKSIPQDCVSPLSEARIFAPIIPQRNVICVGKNYRDHVIEVKKAADEKAGISTQSVEMPKHAVFFTKAPQTIIGHNENIESHLGITKWLDYEAELGIIIKKEGRDIKKKDALNYVFGYTVANDVTARDLQKNHMQFFKGKTLDSSCPLGPCITMNSHISSLGDGSNLKIKLWLNDNIMQDSSTNEMIYDVKEIIAQLSAGFTLLPGDVILTGTPAGVGFARKPPVALKAGDRIKIEIDNIGILNNSVINI